MRNLTHEARLALAVNAATSALARSRAGLMAGALGMGGAVGADEKRQCTAWVEYGWPVNVSFQQLYWLYRRDGIAYGAVEKLLGRCWSEYPDVIEGDEDDEATDETAWEKQNARYLKSAWMWGSFADADRRRLVGRYSGLILHLSDSGKWDQPVKTSAAIRLDKITVAWASALTPIQYDNDVNSKTYGEPMKWRYQEAPKEGFAGAVREIHRDRVFILGSYDADAIGFLEPVYNAFVSLEKVSGGSGESFLKNAARQIAVNFDKDIDFKKMAQQYGIQPEELREALQDSARDLNSANDMLMVTQGATQITPLVSQVADPKSTFDVNLQIVSAGVDMPSKILVGNQTGERASTEDDAYMNRRCQGRRDLALAPEVLRFIEHLQRVKVITETLEPLAVLWGDLTLPTQTERLANGKTMSEINTANLGAGGPVFTNEEIRTASGYTNKATSPMGEPLDDEA